MSEPLHRRLVPQSMQTKPVVMEVWARRAILRAREGLQENVRLEIRDGTIQSVDVGVEWSPSCDSDPGGTVKIFEDGVLVPGLIDAHVHLVSPGTQDHKVDPFTFGERERVLIAGENLHRALSVGLTTVRDCGIPEGFGPSIVKMLNEGWIVGPRVFSSGPALTVTGGHGHTLGIEVDDPSEATKGVRFLKKGGADFIKVMASGGGTRGTLPWAAPFDESMMKAVSREAHSWGLEVTAHATSPTSVSLCLEAGFDGIEHAELLTGPTEYEISPDLIARIADSGILVCPTLTASWRMYRDIEDKSAALDAAGQKRLSFLANLSEQSRKGFRAMVEAGVKIAAGTDAGTGMNPIDDYASELHLMADNGMGLADVLNSATEMAARSVGKDSHLGVLAPGYYGDFTLLGGNPLTDITAYEEVLNTTVAGVELFRK